MSPVPPPGWYVDPTARHAQRWWDGSQWTQHASSRPGEVVADPPPWPPSRSTATQDVVTKAVSAARAWVESRRAASGERILESMPPAGEGGVRAGADARAVLARGRELVALSTEVQGLPATLKAQACHHLRTVQAEQVERRLATIPIERLRESTGGRLRITALHDAGYRFVGQVLHANASQLQRIPGIGVQTAAQVIAAACQVATALTESTPIRLDADQRPAAQTQLLASVRAYDGAERAVTPIKDTLAWFVPAASALLARGSPAANRIGLRVKGGRARQDALAAVAELAALLQRDDVAALAAQLAGTAAGLGVPAADRHELWRDFESRAAEYYSLFGELADLTLDVEAEQGHVPAEIAARVNEQQLDDSLLRVSLRGYQAFGAKFALVQRRAILGDEMGLGKTVEAIAALAHLRALGSTHFLTVCPASVVVNWVQEVTRRSGLRPYRVHGAERDVNLRTWERHGGVAITTFDTLKAVPLPVAPISMLVVDEAHYVKNPERQRSMAVRAWLPHAERVLFLTGTPMENRVDEFRHLVRYLQPDVARGIKPVDGIAGADAFRRAVAPVYLRRNQDDVLAELPPRLEMEDWVELEDQDLDAYRAAVASRNFMAMRRAAYHPGTLDGSAKLARLIEIVEESRDNGWKVVVFSYFRDVLEAVHRVLGPDVLGPLSGSTAPAARQSLVDEFTAIDGHAVLVSQIEAGGTGLNMQAASVVILTEPQWKPTTEEQAIARCHRMGQVRRVHVHRLLARDSVDQRMLEILARKSALFDEYVRRSELKEASPDAVDLSELDATRQVASQVELERQIIEHEWSRLGLTAA